MNANDKPVVVEKTFARLDRAEAHWAQMAERVDGTGAMKDGSGRQVVNELEYCKGGPYTVRTVVMPK